MCCQSARSGDVKSISSLLPGDQVKVIFDSQGCFHHSRYVLTISRDTAFKVAIEGSATQGKILGEIALSTRDIENLDNLLQFYREPHEEICTTVETISITRFHKGEKVHEEKLKDGSCATLSWKDSLTFTSLIERVDKRNEHGQVLEFANSVEVTYRPPPPEYPTELKQLGIQGDIVLMLQLNKEGLISEIVKHSGPDELLKYAEAHARSFKFKVNAAQFAERTTVPFRLQFNYRLPTKSKPTKSASRLGT